MQIMLGHVIQGIAFVFGPPGKMALESSPACIGVVAAISVSQGPLDIPISGRLKRFQRGLLTMARGLRRESWYTREPRDAANCCV